MNLNNLNRMKESSLFISDNVVSYIPDHSKYDYFLNDELDEHFKPITEFDLSKAVFSLEEMMMTRKIPLEDKIRNAIIKKRFITQSFNDDLSLILSKYEIWL